MSRTPDVSSNILRCVAIWVMLVLLLVAPNLHAQNLLLVPSQSSQPYLQTIGQLRDLTDNDRLVLSSRPVGVITPQQLNNNDLIITLGVAALEQVLEQQPQAPILAAMIPKESFVALVALHNAADLIEKGRLSALYLEQPYSRQLRLAQQLVPEARRIGVLLGPQSSIHRAELQQSAQRQQLQLELMQLNPEDNPLAAIRRLVDQSDLLLTLPDKPDFTRNTAKWLLMLSLRKGIPLIGFSRRYVDAGALASVYSSPDSISRELAQWLEQWLDQAQGRLPAPQYPNQFDLSLNPSVAARLGIVLPDQAGLRDRLQLDNTP